MKFLLDENLSPALVQLLSSVYLNLNHVRNLGLKSASDPVIWTYAANEGHTIVTKDADFHQRSFVFGHPPKVIWIRLGNCSTKRIATLFLERHSQLKEFCDSWNHSLMLLE